MTEEGGTSYNTIELEHLLETEVGDTSHNTLTLQVGVFTVASLHLKLLRHLGCSVRNILFQVIISTTNQNLFPLESIRHPGCSAPEAH